MTLDKITGHVIEARKGKGTGGLEGIEMECLCELKGVERGLISNERPQGFVHITLHPSMGGYIHPNFKVTNPEDPKELKGVKIEIRLKRGFFELQSTYYSQIQSYKMSVKHDGRL